MLIKIAFFDKFVEEEVLRNTLGVSFETISKEPIFSANIRLKKKRSEVFTFNTERYYSNVTEFCYGMLYTINITKQDYEWLDYVLKSIDYVRDNITATTIEVNYEGFLRNKYKIKSKSVKCFCYTTNESEYYRSIFKNRHLTVHFHKSLLLNIL